jgi:hypothetical protein
MLRYLPLKELQARPLLSFQIFPLVFTNVLQDIILDTKTELNMDCVRGWLQTSDAYCEQCGTESAD